MCGASPTVRGLAGLAPEYASWQRAVAKGLEIFEARWSGGMETAFATRPKPSSCSDSAYEVFEPFRDARSCGDTSTHAPTPRQPLRIHARARSTALGQVVMSPLVVATGEGRARFSDAAGFYLSAPSKDPSMTESQSQAPLVLVASGGEWVGRSLENVLESNGYTVVRVESGRRALESARRTNPDALLLDDSLPDIGRSTSVARCVTIRCSIAPRRCSSPPPRSRPAGSAPRRMLRAHGTTARCGSTSKPSSQSSARSFAPDTRSTRFVPRPCSTA